MTELTDTNAGSPPRVLFTAFRANAYGAPKMMLHYVEALRAAGHDVTIAYQNEPDMTSPDSTGTVLPAAREAGAKTVQVARLSSAFIPGRCPQVEELARQADVVINSQIRDFVSAAAVARRTGKPCVLFCQNRPDFKGIFPIRQIKQSLYRRALGQWASRGVCVGPGLKQHLVQDVGIPADRLQVIPNGFDLSTFPAPSDTVRQDVRREFGVQEGERLLIAVGRVHRQKGPDVTVDALCRLSKMPDVPPVKVLFVGGAITPEQKQLKTRLEETLTEAGIRDRMIFAGFRDDIARLLQGSDLFLLTCRWEGFFPVAAQEACAARLPVAITDFGEKFPGFVDGRDGWYLPLDDGAGVADKVADVLRMPADELAAVGQAGYDYLRENLSLDRGKAQFVQMVNDVAAEGPRGGGE